MTTPSSSDVEAEVRRRFQAVATGRVRYREAPTVGSDRDVISFYLEWQTKGRGEGAVAVHIDRRSGRLLTYPVLSEAYQPGRSSAWLDALLARVPTAGHRGRDRKQGP